MSGANKKHAIHKKVDRSVLIGGVTVEWHNKLIRIRGIISQ